MTLRENLKDAAQIVENILTQPLKIPGLPTTISLYEASKNYAENPSSIELKKILETFEQHPAAFQIMLQEFKLLADELS